MRGREGRECQMSGCAGPGARQVRLVESPDRDRFWRQAKRPGLDFGVGHRFPSGSDASGLGELPERWCRSQALSRSNTADRNIH